MHQKRKILHQQFIDLLINEMLGYILHTSAIGNPSEHCWEHLEKKRQCVYGLKVRGGCVQGCRKKGRVLRKYLAMLDQPRSLKRF